MYMCTICSFSLENIHMFSTSYHNVLDLEKGKEYQLRIQALTVNGSGPATDWISGETFMHDLDGEPSSVTLVVK